MNTCKMSSDTLFKLACEIIESLEKILSTSLSITDSEVHTQLEENLSYSLSHMRDVFKLSTGISLTKYITQRRYTNILLTKSEKDFNNLKMHESIYGIQKFKSKCLHAFPLLKDKYTPAHMQLPIDKSLLRKLLNIQIEEKGEKNLMNSLFKDIIKGRTPFEINENSEFLIIQNSNNIVVNLEKTYFIFKDKVFKITAELTHNQVEEPFLSILFGRPIRANCNISTNANSVVQSLNNFMIKKSIITNEFTLLIEWGDKHGWGNATLISSMKIQENVLKNVIFIDKPFLIFDNKKVLLNLSFFDNSK